MFSGFKSLYGLQLIAILLLTHSEFASATDGPRELQTARGPVAVISSKTPITGYTLVFRGEFVDASALPIRLLRVHSLGSAEVVLYGEECPRPGCPMHLSLLVLSPASPPALVSHPDFSSASEVIASRQDENGWISVDLGLENGQQKLAQFTGHVLRIRWIKIAKAVSSLEGDSDGAGK